MRRVLAVVVLLAVLPAAAQARKVLNPTLSLAATLTSGSLTDASFDPPSQSTFASGGQLIGGASIDIAGAITVPTALVAVPTVHFPDVTGSSNGVDYSITNITLTLAGTEPATGTLDPFTGAASLGVHVKARVTYTGCTTNVGPFCYSPSTPQDDPDALSEDACVISPIEFALSTAGGTPYDETAGTVTVRDDAFAIPGGTQGCDPKFNGLRILGAFNSAAKLPSGTGKNSLVASVQLAPVIRRGVIAAVTATPTTPRNALIDATGSQVPAGVRSYEFDADGDPAGAFEAMTGDGILGVGFPTAGPHVVRARVTDVDGDSDVASTTVDVAAGAGPPPPQPASLRAGDIVRLPSARRCRRTRTLRLTVLPSADAKVSAVTVTVGRRHRRVTGAALTRPITIRHLPRGAYTVRVVVILANGTKLPEHRRYRTCRPTT